MSTAPPQAQAQKAAHVRCPYVAANVPVVLCSSLLIRFGRSFDLPRADQRLAQIWRQEGTPIAKSLGFLEGLGSLCPFASLHSLGAFREGPLSRRDAHTGLRLANTGLSCERRVAAVPARNSSAPSRC